MAITSVASAASDTQLLAAGGRSGLTIVNTDANRLYVALDNSAASTSNYSFFLDTGDYFDTTGYRGEVRGIWAGDGSGVALITTWGN